MMKLPKVFHCRTTKTGPTRPVTVRFSHYSNNGCLAVLLDEAHSPWCRFATITVNLNTNLYGMDKNKYAFVDTNNCPWAEEFLQENKIAKPTGFADASGYCTYPLYEFFPDAVWEEK